jgi:4-oxalocrotonate tautomerase
MWEGRSKETKKQLVKEVTDVVCKVLSCPKNAVTIILHEVSKDNWSSEGELASEKFK